MRIRRTLLLGLALVLAASACAGERITFKDTVREALTATSLQPRDYVYEDAIQDGPTSIVEVTVEDDFRYAASWSEDGRSIYEEVVRDDALAVRAADVDEVLDRIGTPTGGVELDGATATAADGADVPAPTEGETGGEGAEGTTEPDADTASGSEITSLDGRDVLRDGDWAVDQIGAPPLTVRVTVDDLGDDPIVDAVGVLSLVSTTLSETPRVGRWDDSAIEYRPDEDPFRPPVEDEEDPLESEVRYDLAPQPPLNRADVTDAGSGSAATPAMLRQMAVYVDDGFVTEVRIRIDASAVFEDIERTYGLPTDGTDEERAARALEQINRARGELGQEPIVPRDITVRFGDVGNAQQVALPEGQITSLAFLNNRGSADGRIPEEPEEEVPAPEVAEPEEDVPAPEVAEPAS